MVAAYAAIYLIWGSTYLAIRLAVDSIPPLFMMGVRCAAAGALMLVWAAVRGERATLRHWGHAAFAGALMFAGSYGALAWAEQRVASGIAALLSATTPFWLTAFEWSGGSRPSRRSIAGLIVGLAGVAVLVGGRSTYQLRPAAPGDSLAAFEASSPAAAPGTPLDRRSIPAPLHGAGKVAAGTMAGRPPSFAGHSRRRELRRDLAEAFAAAGRALPPGRLAGPGATPDVRHELLAPIVAILAGTLAWAAGSFYARPPRVPRSLALSAGMSLTAGGALLLAASWSAGELTGFSPREVSSTSLAALAYLVVFGSLVGFSAYSWLLRVAPPSRVATHAYVNPLVAIALGSALAGEPLTSTIVCAGLAIAAGVAFVLAGQIRSTEVTESTERTV